MIEPDFQTFCRLARQGNLVPVYETFTADLLTPVGAYLRMARHARYACLLESVEGGEKIARYTFVGANPTEVFRYVNGACVLESESRISWVQSNPLDFLRNRIQRYRPVRVPGLPPLVAGAIGYFAYDIVRLFERIPDRSQNDLGTDDAVMMFYLGLVVFDHVRHRVWVVRNVFTEGPGSLRSKYRATVREISETRRLLELPLDHNRRKPNRPATRLRVQSNFTRSRYLAAVRKSKEYVRAGDVFQVVISQRFSARTLADPFDIYRALRVLNPSPYMYFLKLGDTAIVGSSPELLLKVQGRDAYYRPIAGTRPRGKDENEDQRLAAELAADPKERAEHIMLVDLGRNDLGRVSEYGSVRVERLEFVEHYSHVMHLVSTLRSRLRPDVDCIDALAACFPAGTVSGAPKVRAMEIIDELEPTRRGIYAGAILYLDFSGNLDSCIAIRTMVVKRGLACVQAGAGLVADSVPEREYQETVNKARALIAALEVAHGGGDGRSLSPRAAGHSRRPRRARSARAK
ncbi:MAG: anthranilate synthase component I [Acidobacteria bacterium]|nr:MAG: anthranilate synthase component I [Acidobacteriota bacterium]